MEGSAFAEISGFEKVLLLGRLFICRLKRLLGWLLVHSSLIIRSLIFCRC